MQRQEIKYFIDRIGPRFPFTLIDVGAMGGISLKWKNILGAMRVIAFEPDPREFHKLKNNDSITYLNCALYDKPEDLRYYLTKETSKSSILKPNWEFLSQYEDTQRYQVVKEEGIPSARVRNLDSLLEEKSIEDADFLKIDTQGTELFILRGGQKKVVPRLFGAQIETEFSRLYENQHLFRHIDEFMDDNGFQLIDLKRQYWKRKDYYDYSGKGQIIFGDALYFKKIDVFGRELSAIEDKSCAKSKVFKSILICLTYKMFDYAVAVANAGLKNGYLGDDEHKNIIYQIKKYSLRGTPLYFRLNARLFNVISSILQRFRPASYLGWSDSDREIGNVKDN